MDVITNKINIFLGAVTSVLVMLFGDFWIFFAAFFVLNIVDYITGTMKARLLKLENSNKGAIGIAKKVGYWVIIGIAFFVAVSCVELGKTLGLDLMFLSFVGYFTLAIYIINEIRSIIENLVMLGVHVPEFLTKGLAIADKLVNDAANSKVDKEK